MVSITGISAPSLGFCGGWLRTYQAGDDLLGSMITVGEALRALDPEAHGAAHEDLDRHALVVAFAPGQLAVGRAATAVVVAHFVQQSLSKAAVDQPLQVQGDGAPALVADEAGAAHPRLASRSALNCRVWQQAAAVVDPPRQRPVAPLGRHLVMPNDD